MYYKLFQYNQKGIQLNFPLFNMIDRRKNIVPTFCEKDV